MKFRVEYVIPMVILVVVMIISLCDSCLYFMPYDPEGYDNVDPEGYDNVGVEGYDNINVPLSSTDAAFAKVTPVGAIQSAIAPVQTTNRAREGF